MEIKETDQGKEVLLTAEEATTICRTGQGRETCRFLIMDQRGFVCVREFDDAEAIAYMQNNSHGMGGWTGCPWHDEADDAVTIWNCLKCGKELTQKTKDINRYISIGIICPFCNHGHRPSDFVALAKKV